MPCTTIKWLICTLNACTTRIRCIANVQLFTKYQKLEYIHYAFSHRTFVSYHHTIVSLFVPDQITVLFWFQNTFTIYDQHEDIIENSTCDKMMNVYSQASLFVNISVKYFSLLKLCRQFQIQSQPVVIIKSY